MEPRNRRAAASAAASAPTSSCAGGGSRLAEELVGEVEERVEQLEKCTGLWSKQAEAHLGPAPASEASGEAANVWYFAYGSNMNKKVFSGRRMIQPAESLPAVLQGWQLTFSQLGLPYAEPGFAAVEPQPEALAADAANGSSSSGGGHGSSGNGSESNGASRAQHAQRRRPDVHGVLHRITPSQWCYVLETEGASQEDSEDGGYAVVTATAVTYDGKEVQGVKTLTVPARIKQRLQGQEALPSRRYLTLIREGAADYGLHPEYQAWLAGLRHYQAETAGQKVGGVLFKLIALAAIFPVWGSVRLLRKVTGMQAASNDAASRFMRAYTARAFTAVHGLHAVLRPALGCGMSGGKAVDGAHPLH
ncbi:hypothetical protein ABPG75_000739 [Micractinium tetrahymenae]